MCARTGMARPGLVCWLRIFLIRAGFSEPRAPSPGATAGFAFACISWRAREGSRASCDVYTMRVCNCYDGVTKQQLLGYSV